VVSRWTGVFPFDKMAGEGRRKDKLLRMEDMLARRVVARPKAVHAVATAVAPILAPGAAGTRNRPMGSFMFLGPTGVGKTGSAPKEAASASPEYLFDNETAMVRLDMSE